MTPINTVSSIAIPFNHDNVDTDQLLPKQFLTEISRKGFGKHLLHDIRYLDQYEQVPNPDCVLNKTEYSGAEIFIAGDNFGCGSSREHAPWALADFGIKVIIAKSFADIFYTNCLNNQILPVALVGHAVDTLASVCQSLPSQTITVNLPKQLVTCANNEYRFNLAAHHKQNLMLGIDKIGRTLMEEGAIKTYERTSVGSM
ncbi:3-isopropylmalate dehydratase small subunit [Alteromonas sp. V450]|uniref:3-isopropylmalate dehydratase small subunit n=1 Tax=Alteromonas sp. V450 TaxID=1912139 RepID=UPI0008FF198C|nr:3-isopropylmalate dehydratase small subunit [Alteromonas sp. V450]OJF70622.1 3-isopropylmalate dehydratase small subunit [Alteromonas sp. V450]